MKINRREFLNISLVFTGVFGTMWSLNIATACSTPPHPSGKFPIRGMINLTDGPLIRYLERYYPGRFSKGSSYDAIVNTSFNFDSEIASTKASDDWQRVTTNLNLPDYFNRIRILRIELLSQKKVYFIQGRI